MAHGEAEIVVRGGVERDACIKPRCPLCPRQKAWSRTGSFLVAEKREVRCGGSGLLPAIDVPH